MGKYEKLLHQILRGTSDTNIAFDDLCNLSRRLGFDERTRGSHHVFRKKGIVEKINLQRDGSKTKVYRVSSSPGEKCNIEIQTWGETLMYRYEMIFYWSNEDKVYIAEVPELPGCMAHGSSYDKALGHIKEAIQLWLDTAKEFGDPISEPKGRRLMLA